MWRADGLKKKNPFWNYLGLGPPKIETETGQTTYYLNAWKTEISDKNNDSKIWVISLDQNYWKRNIISKIYYIGPQTIHYFEKKL